MSYQVIARKYRPQRFEEVVGQEHVTRTLGNAIRQNRIAHAYLFCGPRGTGKTTIARIFAKCLNCTDGPKAEFAENDPRCQEIAEGRSLDVLEIDGASNRGIEEIRELRETVRYAPAAARFKIYIIDEVHMLTKEAFNALLKTLEEPPAHVKFLFATTEPEKVLPTILSRCQRFDLRRIPASLIVQHLAQIAKTEGVSVDEAALHAVARGADGGMRDAESTLDQLISFCGNRIEETDVLAMFGLAARSQVLDLVNAILQNDPAAVLHLLNQLCLQGKDLGRLLADLLSHFRNLLVFNSTRGDLSLLELSEAEAAAIAVQAPGAQSEALTRILDVLTLAEARLRDAASKRIYVEITLFKAIEATRAVSIDTLLATLQQLRENDAPGAGPTHATLPPSPTVPADSPRVARAVSGQPAAGHPAPAPAPAGEGSSSLHADLATLWTRLASAVGRANPFIRSYLTEAHPVSLADEVLTIGFDPEFADHLALIDVGRNRTLIETKLHELGIAQAKVKFVQAERPLGWTPGAEVAAPAPSEERPARRQSAARPSNPAPPVPDAGSPLPPKALTMNLQDFKNDPLIQKALEIFRGQIIDVRS